jgi:hypothetical protein
MFNKKNLVLAGLTGAVLAFSGGAAAAGDFSQGADACTSAALLKGITDGMAPEGVTQHYAENAIHCLGPISNDLYGEQNEALGLKRGFLDAVGNDLYTKGQFSQSDYLKDKALIDVLSQLPDFLYTNGFTDENGKKMGVADIIKALDGKATRALNATHGIQNAAHGIQQAQDDATEALNSVKQANENIGKLDRRVSDLNKKMEKGLASSAAISSLFQPYNVGKFNFTAGVGGYKNETALAIGSGYRFTDLIAAKAALATSLDSKPEVTYSASVNFEW